MTSTTPTGTMPTTPATLYLLSLKPAHGQRFSHAFVTEVARRESRLRFGPSVASAEWELSLPIAPERLLLRQTDEGFLIEVTDVIDPLTDAPVVVAQAFRRGATETRAEAREDSPLSILFHIPPGVRLLDLDGATIDAASEDFVLAWQRYETDAAVLAALGFVEIAEYAMPQTRTAVRVTGDSPGTRYDPATRRMYAAPPNQYTIVVAHPASMLNLDRWLTEQALAYLDLAGLGDEATDWGELDLDGGHPAFHAHLLAHGVRLLPPAASAEPGPDGIPWPEIDMHEQVGVL